ncbi:MAG: hypothetical protein HKN23_18925, partial [Verrucomicrobiales bacterium]|nr:hypothetical protein [Verrucomicrobiales bacterium]
GYFGPRDRVPGVWPADDYLICYAAAVRLLRERKRNRDRSFYWDMVRKIGRHTGLGDIGTEPGDGRNLDFATGCSRPDILMGLLELFRATDDRAFLDLACKVGDNILESRFENGLFKPDGPYKFTRTSRPESMALLHLAASLTGRSGEIPAYFPTKPYFACEIRSTDSKYSFDHNVIYTQLKEAGN